MLKWWAQFEASSNVEGSSNKGAPEDIEKGIAQSKAVDVKFYFQTVCETFFRIVILSELI